ncbi:ABC transporter permease subunit [Hymenobacter sp. UYCo722]|uniref:ABC transporter permease n=1 Tax=Hymenobacter sp. UYCo722 TaxID=3156335 RepID=UPI00339206DC
MAGLNPFFSRRPLGWLLAWAWLAGLVLLAVLAPALPLPYAPGVPDLAHVAEAPSAITQHWLGTDPRGCDVLSGLVFGTRTALLLTLPAALLAALLGGLTGGAAGFWGNRLLLEGGFWGLGAVVLGWSLGVPPIALAIGAGAVATLWAWCRLRRVPTAIPIPLDSLVLSAATGLDTVPRLVLVLVLVARGGFSLIGLGLLLGLTSWAGPARLVRARMLAVRALPFVEAARASGLSEARVWWHHALPHALRPLQTALPLSLAGLLALESTLSFLGVGLAPDVPSWGQQLAAARQQPQAWWAFVFPAIILFISILSTNAITPNRTSRPT